MLTLRIDRVVDLPRILRVADDLVSEPGSNSEYEGALVTLIADLFCADFVDADMARASVRALLGWTEEE